MTLPFISWLFPQTIIGGDWPFFWQKNINEFLSYTYAWDASLNSGLGKSNLEILWLNTYLGYGGHFLSNILHIPWNLAEKILFFWPIILFLILSPYVLSGLFTKRRLFRLLSSVVYLANTYTFMIASGGQVGILLSYAVAPLSLYYFIRLVRDSYSHRGIHTAIQFGLILSLQILFEPRMFIITLVSFVLFALLHIVVHPLTKKSFIQFFKMLLLNLLISVGLVLFLHSFWILPVIASLATKSSFTSLSTITTADYFSFTRFENAFSLLHANWPENISSSYRIQFVVISQAL
ncbi:MAG: hypothetical protein UU78_C0092G0002 [Candidatus Roizmanbacteria bacterium GW2011_GWC2_41_7]|uniref:Glycosyltransferase RgtA/B/C/D-like domain-containing protein n=1 Tax=Candidatus Roizmanbacteria bacterium GW2011_GWC2_41_7 TaxID=1618487 RepID=A0A0G0ZAQ1_9BACT|nr:MAG: hypothetical protein UU78_C0092G0002 [Candidatus Roizmanbacteria bacterium GW2011_GWC2_41_7]